ncbi:MAG TPA: calcium-binding protein, partial [Myxococcota bacterium]
MTTKKKLLAVAGGLAAFALTGCGPMEEPKDVGDVSGVEEIGQPLAALATAPTFASGTLTIALAAGGETAIVSRHAVSGNILVNDVATTGATATAVKNVAITGGAGDDTVILDFANGTFAPGVTGGPGITVALAGGTNVFKLRGASATGDTITVGGSATAVDIAFNIDAFKDIAVTSGSAVALTFSLGGGNDIYNALSGANGTGGAAFAGDATIYGGLGDDTLTGGDGDETFYGDLGNDTLNGGTSNADGDVYNGGGGSDTVTYAARSAALTITVGAGAADGETATETDDIKGDVEIVRGGSGIDTFTGHAGDQIFYGGAGDDIFLMGDTTTGAGNDTVYGEAGNDTVSYAARTGAVTATMDL